MVVCERRDSELARKLRRFDHEVRLASGTFSSDDEDNLEFSAPWQGEVSALKKEWSMLNDYIRGGVQVQPDVSIPFQVKRANLLSEYWFDVVHYDGKGRGVRSRQEFGRNVVVLEYFGAEILSPEAFADFERARKAGNVGERDSQYQFRMKFGGNDVAIQARLEDDTLGRLVNHASPEKANCMARPLSSRKMPRIIIVTTKDVHVGDELLYDYNDPCISFRPRSVFWRHGLNLFCFVRTECSFRRALYVCTT